MVYLSIICLTMISCNSYLFYQAPRYDDATIKSIRQNPQIVEISYPMSFGEQTSLYVKPQSEPDQVPERLWILFGGINATAFGWYEWFSDIPDKRCGLLLIEYPGYGLCEGVPREERILISTLTAFRALALHLNVPVHQLENNLGLLGHSLGSLTMMQFAAHVKADRILLISPMTSLSEQVKIMYGYFKGSMLNIINPEKYDNRVRLKEVLQFPEPPQITIIHGSDDELIPVSMGRELASLSPGHIRFYEIDGHGHPGLIKSQLSLIFKIMFDSKHN